MNTAETSRAIVYNFPPQITERQRWINHLSRYSHSLIAWYIGRGSGRLFGCYEGKNFSVWFAAFKLEGDRIIFDYKAWFKDDIDFYKSLGAALVSGVTPAMGKFIGIYKNDPPAPEGRIVYFPGQLPPPDEREFVNTDLMIQGGMAWLCMGAEISAAGISVVVTGFDNSNSLAVFVQKIFTGTVDNSYSGAFESFYQWAIETNLVFESPDGVHNQVRYTIITGSTILNDKIDVFISRFPGGFMRRGWPWFYKMKANYTDYDSYIAIQRDYYANMAKSVKIPGAVPLDIDETPLILSLAARSVIMDRFKNNERKEKRPERELPIRQPKVFTAPIYRAVPPGIPDYRAALQRDGLILLSYARCYDYNNESWRGKPQIKKYWLAYWVTADEKKPRYYESNNIYTEADFAHAMPESYCGDNYKDGGVRTWDRVPWIVHVAPECFDISAKARTGAIDPRPDHVAILRGSGYRADYDHEFKLTDERAKQAAIKRARAARKKLWKAKMLIQAESETEAVKEN